MILFHRTTSERAARILAGGFRDGVGSYLTDRQWSGVWVSNRPLDLNEGAEGEALLRIELDLTEAEIAESEWVEERKTYREWLLPAALLNPRARITLVEDEEIHGWP